MMSYTAILKAIAAGGLSLLLSCSGNREKSTEVTEHLSTILSDSVDLPIPPCKKLKISTSGALPISSLPVVETIEFSDTTEHFIGIPSCIVVRGDTIFAIDSSKAPGFYAYLRDGSQIFAYTSTGQGPEDFMTLKNLIVTDTEVSAFDFPTSHLFVINKKGEFVRRTKIPTYAVAAAETAEGGIWVDFSNFDGMMDDIKLGWTPPGGRPDSLITVLPIPEYLKGLNSSVIKPIAQLPDGEWIFTPAFERYVYTLREDKAYPRYELDFGNLWWDDEKMSKMAHSNDWAIQIRDFPVHYVHFHENNQWVVIGFNVNFKDNYLYVYNKSTDDSRIYHENKKRYFLPLYIDGNDVFMSSSDNSNLQVLRLSE